MHLCDSCNMKNCNNRTVRDLQKPACVIFCSDYIGGQPTFPEIAEPCERVCGPYVSTNADRIRNWNDHELAEVIANLVSEIDNGNVRYSDDPNDWLKWLQQPSE